MKPTGAGRRPARALAVALLLLAAAACDRTDVARAGAADGAALASADVVVLGATPGGITAAVAAARAGRSAMIVDPTRWVGGMMSGGLSKTDTGRRGPEVFGGLAAEFFERVRQIERERNACIGPCEATYDFEPHVAERVFEDLIREAGVVLVRGAELLGVHKDATTITAIETSRGTVGGKVFVDASYEGDLMARAGVGYTIGREPRLREHADDATALALQEDHAGEQPYRLPLGVHVDPYRVPGDAASGTVAFVEPRPATPLALGAGDTRVMAYVYRLCVTDDPTNRIPFTAPEGFDAADYEMHARLAAAAPADVDVARSMFNPSPTTLSRDARYNKYDLNGTFTLSTDLTAPGLNHDYVEASPQRRDEIELAYRRYIQGLLWAWQTEPRFGALNARVASFGYCADEFSSNGGWPQQFYVRVGRRMLGEYVMNENDVLQNGRREPIRDVVAFGSYSMGTHAHQYLAAPMEAPGGGVRDAIVIAGVVIVPVPNAEPYPISYRSLTPRASEARNLLNPVTLSATNLAFSGIRMEPTLMMLGEAAGTAAALSIEANVGVQDVDYETLRQRLVAQTLLRDP